MSKVKRILSRNAVPILFAIVCLLGVFYANRPFQFLLMEIVKRMARNSFLVLSLIIPVVAGMGLNFGIVLETLGGSDRPLFSPPLGVGWHWRFGPNSSSGNSFGCAFWNPGGSGSQQGQGPGDDHRYGHGLFCQWCVSVYLSVLGGYSHSL